MKLWINLPILTIFWNCCIGLQIGWLRNINSIIQNQFSERFVWKNFSSRRLQPIILKQYFIQIFCPGNLNLFFLIEVKRDNLQHEKYLSKYFTQATRELSGERRITRNLTELKHQLDPAHKVKNPDKSWLWNFQKQKSSGKLNGT